MAMDFCVISHSPFEGLGSIMDWCNARSHHVTLVNTYASDPLPPIDSIDALIVMGGPQSPRELAKYPYLQLEMDFILAVINENKPILGVCLGAQLIGEALGAKTESSPYPEMGFFDVSLTPAGQKDPLFEGFKTSFLSGHWHNDMPGLPDGASVLATSDGCPRQVIRFSERVLGFQSHFELTHEVMAGFINKFRDDLVPARFVQTADAMLSADFKAQAVQMKRLLDRLFVTV
jgi:GMP synthase (glutamine-hydrolysing)